MTLALAGITLILIGFCIYLSWSKDILAKEHALERGAMHSERTNLIAAAGHEREEWTKERSELLTRIQHPQVLLGPQGEVKPDEEYFTSEPDDIDLVGVVVSGPDESNG